MGSPGGSSGGGTERRVLDWLLEPDQPSVRYYALRDLLGRSEQDPEVRRARARLARVGWAADLLRLQKPEGFWEPREPASPRRWMQFLQFPRFRSTLWRVIVLSDLGLTSADPRVRRAAGLLFDYKLRLGSPFNFFTEEVCAVGNVARLLIRFGYGEDRRVQRLFSWMVDDQRKDGGWNCLPDRPGTLDCWEALAAFAALPPSRRSRSLENAIARGAEFYLERGLLREGRPYPPWLRFHYPTHYYYDVLVGLDILTRLGYGDDRRLRPALAILRSKQRADGTWLLGPAHPDVGPGAEYADDRRGATSWTLEAAGRPSKWITLTALRVLARAAS